MTRALDDLHRAVGLGPDERARLVALHDAIAPQLGAIADGFVRAVAGEAPDAAAIRAARAARTAVTARTAWPARTARTAVIDWLSTGLRGPYDDVFHARRLALVTRLVEIGAAPAQVIAGVNAVRRACRDALGEAGSGELRATGEALDKLLDVELAVVLRDIEREQDREQDPQPHRDHSREHSREQIEALQTLCAGLAHEVRNPVNAARLQLELAHRRLRRAGGGPDLVDPIERAEHEIDRLTVLLDEFLAFAQPPRLDPQPHDVVALVRRVVERDQPRANDLRAALTLVAAASPVIAEVDAVKIGQIVETLVCNAIEAVLPGGRVEVVVDHDADHVHIRVSDDGRGIPAEILPRIYEPFFSTKQGGTGMGMSIAHSLVALHRGTIDVDSSPAGTTFKVAVPRRCAASSRH